MRVGEVYLYNEKVGTITESIDGEYLFEYLNEYVESGAKEGISLILPPTQRIYKSDKLFSFFDGIIPEGWLLNYSLKNWKIDLNDRMGLLLNVCQDAIGAVHVSSGSNQEEDHLKLSIGDLAKVSLSDIEKIAKKQVNRRLSMTGVQRKLSLNIDMNQTDSRYTFVDFNGTHILKPPGSEFPRMPQFEFVCMKIAKAFGFNIPRCSLVALQDENQAFLVERFDRKKGNKLYQEDFCQLLNKPAKDKYKGSLEKASKIIDEYCPSKKANKSIFFDLNLYCFLTGNSDMHLKNFSLVKIGEQDYQLSPCYDLVPTKIFIPDDIEESALAINGKKNKIKAKDWLEFAKSIGLSESFVKASFSKFKKSYPKLVNFIKQSCLNEDEQELFIKLITTQFKKLELL